MIRSLFIYERFLDVTSIDLEFIDIPDFNATIFDKTLL